MHRKRFFSLIAFVLALALTGVAQQISKPKKPAKHYRELKYPPLNPINVPEPTRFELPNGMVVYLVEDHELPMITVSALIRVGSRWEPAEKAGLASITGTVMRTGGTTSKSGDELDELLDGLGGSVEIGVGQDSGNATVSVLKEDIDQGLGILADVLMNPAFPQDKIDLEKIQQRDAIARRNDQPTGIVFREFARLIYGPDSPYARQTEYDTINAITRADLAAFHGQFFQPENVILGAWGDFQADQMRAKIEAAFSGWKRGGQPKPTAPAVRADPASRAGLRYIKKDDVNQSWVVMGFLSGRRDDPDYYALTVMDRILGGGFSSRLFNNVRSKEGLAYAVFSDWGAEWDHPGIFMASGGSKSETTVRILNAIKREIEQMSQSEVTDAELSLAKDGILKGFAFDFDSTDKIVRRLMTYEYYGYPRDYLQRYRDNIEKVTKADVRRVAQQYLKADRLAILVMGKEQDFDQPLSALGPVAMIDITIPGPKSEAVAAATPESRKRGRDIMSRVLQAAGGEAVRAIRDYTETSNVTASTPQGEFTIALETIRKLPHKSLAKMRLPFGEVMMAFDGQQGWMRGPQGEQELPEAQKKEALEDAYRETVYLLQNFDHEWLDVQALDPVEVDGNKLDVVLLTDRATDYAVKLFVDPGSGLLVKKAYVGGVMGAPGNVEETYSDYRELNGVKWPFKVIVHKDGKKVMKGVLTEVKINTGVEDSVFSK